MECSKPNAADLNYLRTSESRRRKIPQLKRLYELMQQPGMLSLAGGTPNASIFPFDGVGTTTLSPPFADGVAAPKFPNSNMTFRVFQTNKESATSQQAGTTLSGDIELSSALQYGSAAGDDRLREFVREHMSRTHDIAFKDWDVVLSVGNTFGWDAVLRVFAEPHDTLLFEDFTFPSALENAQNRGCRCYGVKTDEFGLVPEDLERKAEIFRPKLLYTIPTGQNPTGSVLSLERRKKVMQIAREYDFLVIEDEPYYYLQMENSNSTGNVSDFLRSLVPSMLAFDTDGRVIRLDSFSKVLAPGIRLGWITAQQRFTEALREVAESSSSKPSGFAQTLVYGVLRRWGQDGFVDWLKGLRDEYTERRDLCCNVLSTELSNAGEMVKLIVPSAGMFFWLRIELSPEQLERVGRGRSSARAQELKLFERLADEYKVLVVPGHWCKVDADKSSLRLVDRLDDNGTPVRRWIPNLEPHRYVYFRGTFASESKAAVVDGAHRLAAGLKEFLNLGTVEQFCVVEKDDAYL